MVRPDRTLDRDDPRSLASIRHLVRQYVSSTLFLPEPKGRPLAPLLLPMLGQPQGIVDEDMYASRIPVADLHDLRPKRALPVSIEELRQKRRVVPYAADPSGEAFGVSYSDGDPLPAQVASLQAWRKLQATLATPRIDYVHVSRSTVMDAYYDVGARSPSYRQTLDDISAHASKRAIGRRDCVTVSAVSERRRTALDALVLAIYARIERDPHQSMTN